MKRRFAGLFTLVALMMLSACAVNSVPFAPESEVPSGKALVYVYRPQQFVDASVTFKVLFNGQEAPDKLYNARYFPYFADPGRTEVVLKNVGLPSKVYGRVDLDLKPGQTYYLKAGRSGKTEIVLKLIEMDAAVARPEIEKCSWIKAAE